MKANKYPQVQGHANLVRAPSGAIINIDTAGIAQARNRKKIWKEQQAELEELRNDVANMKKMMQQILEDKNVTSSS
tara:strand:- start:12 stop:239 length:228 start_codon:yes stop_codon:yes gene_type:complete